VSLNQWITRRRTRSVSAARSAWLIGRAGRNAERDAGREVAMGAARGDGEDSPRLIDMIVASMTTASQAFSRNAKAARLEEALRQLPEEQREAIRMRHVENLSSREIAERLGKSDVAIRVMLSRTVRKLQEILGIEDR
jgi:RNA polymerase sigma-70 factor (ECF subfamily)